MIEMTEEKEVKKMLYCSKCKVDIRGNKQCCPLCGGRLQGEVEDTAFPALKAAVNRLDLVSVATFIFFVAEIVLFTVQYLARHEKGIDISWIFSVKVGFLVAWVDFLIAMYLKNNLLNIVTFEAYIAMIANYAIDYYTGFHKWSIHWMIPLTFIGLALFIIIVALIGKMRTEDYIVHLIIAFIACMVQIIPILWGTNEFLWPAVICIAFYLILAAALLVFRYHELKTASAKYFNV